MARALLTSTPSTLLPGPSTCKGIYLAAILALWQIPKDARTWRLVRAEKSIGSWQIMFFMSQHILAVEQLYKLHNIAAFVCLIWHLIRTSTNSLNKYLWTEAYGSDAFGHICMNLRRYECHLNFSRCSKADVQKTECLTIHLFISSLTSLSLSSTSALAGP